MRKLLGGLVDADYIAELPEADQQWLLSFVQEYYFGNKTKLKLHTKEQMAKIRTDLKATAQDVYTTGFFDLTSPDSGDTNK